MTTGFVTMSLPALADAIAPDGSEVAPGVITIPIGTRFQFRTVGDEPFRAVGVTLPPWPGDDEAVVVAGPWAPTI